MHSTPARRSITSVVLVALLLLPANIFPCGMSSPEPVFTVRGSPDAPLELFAQGRLGIVLPSYQRTFLVVAYRYLAGKPPNQEEQAAFVKAWTPNFEHLSSGENALAIWNRARSLALPMTSYFPPSDTIYPYRTIQGGWHQYLNCAEDAFVSAADTATSLVKSFGAGSAAVRDWVRAQDTVFANCGPVVQLPLTPERASELRPRIPAAATLDNAVLKIDRQYQIASANFYAGELQTAAQQFEKIAADRDSPWHTWAPYLVARCYIRQATLNSPSGSANAATDAPRFNVEQMTAAEKQLQGILKDPSLAAIHPASQRLLNYVEVRLHPDQRLYEISQQLSGHTAAATIDRDLIDFDWIIDKQLKSSGGMKSPKLTTWHDDLAKRGLLDDLTDWVLTFQQQNPEALDHAIQRWHATNSEAWLMAAISMAKGADSNSKALAEAAASVPQSSPAYEMAVYQRVRLLIEQKQQNGARQVLDANLPRFEKGPLSAFNLLLKQRFAVAADFGQFLQYAPRTPVEYVEYDYLDCGDDCTEGSYAQNVNAAPLPKILDGDSSPIFNERLPLSLLTQAARESVLPSALRGYIATTTWTRAAIIGDAKAAKAVEASMADAHPELHDYVKDYGTADSAEARFFAATWTMLHFPGMQPFIYGGALRDTKFDAIDEYRNNWWCGGQFPATALPPGTVSYGNGPPIDPATGKQAVPVPVVPPPFPSFLTASERANADDQRSKLSTLVAGRYMGRVVLDWAKAHPDDQRLPEALHLVVRATRYGCSANTTARSASRPSTCCTHVIPVRLGQKRRPTGSSEVGATWASRRSEALLFLPVSAVRFYL